MKMVSFPYLSLTAKQLDYAAAIAIGWQYHHGEWIAKGGLKFSPASEFSPSTDWAHLGILMGNIPLWMDVFFDGMVTKTSFPRQACFEVIENAGMIINGMVEVPEGEY